MDNISGESRFKLHFPVDTIIQCNKWGARKQVCILEWWDVSQAY